MAEANALTAELELGAIHQDHVMLRTTAEHTPKITPMPVFPKVSLSSFLSWPDTRQRITKVCVSCQKIFKYMSKMYLMKKSFTCFRLAHTRNHLFEASKAKEKSPAAVTGVPSRLYFQVLVGHAFPQRESERRLSVL